MGPTAKAGQKCISNSQPIDFVDIFLMAQTGLYMQTEKTLAIKAL